MNSELIAKIEAELNKYSLKEIRAAYVELSNLYRKDRENIHLSLNSPQRRLAYIAARMPATYSAVWNVLQELNDKSECTSLLDVGSGSGTASFAACDVLENLNKVTAIEQNQEMIKIGKNLTAEHNVLKNIYWSPVNMLSANFPEADVVIMSYSLNEIPMDLQQNLLHKLWASAKNFLVIVEAGTRTGFGLIHTARKSFIQQGVSILAPCPHANICPAYNNEDFCHFSARVQRTSCHRYLKSGERNFEDEKYSYLILTKMPKENVHARVVRKPICRTGFVSLKLCTPNGFITQQFSKKDQNSYKLFKNAQWGDKFSHADLTESL